MASPLTVTDCGPAQIFSTMAYNGIVNVSGTTHPKTGFLGLMVAEGGQGWQNQSSNDGLYNFNVTDNQNLLVGPYYSEQKGNDVSLLRGAGTTTGRVTFQVLNVAPTWASVSVNVNNYAGRLFYGGGLVNGGGGNPQVQITQTGANPIDLMLADDYFVASAPNPVLGSGANLIATLNTYGVEGMTPSPLVDTPNPLTAANYASLAASLDDFRQLSALNLAVEYGIVNPSGLVAYWKLDETASPSIDSSMSGITGTWVNGPTFSATKPSSIPYVDAGSMAFNGSNQYINMGNPAGLPTGTHARTICAWAKSASGLSGYRMFASYGTGANHEGFWLGANGAALSAGSWGDDLPDIPGFWDGNWHFIAMTYDGTTAKLYADGVLKESAAKTWTLVPSVCYVGCYLNQFGFWNGSVDDVRIYNRALSATEIANLDGLVIQTMSAEWKLNETTGPYSYDSSGNNLTGTWANNPVPSTNVPPGSGDTGSLLFNGTNQYVTMGDPPGLPSGTAPRTICGWAKSNGLSSYGMFASFGTPANGEGFWIGANGTALSAGSWGDDLPDIPGFWDGNWHFIAMTYDGVTAKLYADGVLKEYAAKTWNLFPSVCYVGCYLNGTCFWNGNVADVRVYNYALSATQISALVSQPQSPAIGINFASANGGLVDNITAATGVINIAAADWNNITGGAAGTYTGPIIDSQGNTVTGATVTYSSSDLWSTGNTSLGNLFNSYLDTGNISVTVTNIPYATYDVYAYVGSGADGRVSPGGTIGSETLSYTTASAHATSFVINSNPAAVNPSANVLLFTNVTGSSFTYTQAGGGGNSGNGIHGLEIVKKP